MWDREPTRESADDYRDTSKKNMILVLDSGGFVGGLHRSG